MNTRKFKGTGVAMVTPFHKDGSIDFKGFGKLIESLIAGKADYLVVLGTTGETPVLTKDEKNALLDFARETNNGRLPLVLGIGGNNTRDVVNCIRETDLEGVDAILSVSPYYNRPGQKGIVQHFKMVAGNSPVPVILYNVPARTGSNMLAETTLELALSSDNIIGIKEASGNLDQITRILAYRPKDFLVISGDDNLTFSMMAMGADGVISVVANAFPRDYSSMVRLCLKGEFEKACKLHFRFLDIYQLLFAEGNPVGVKAALSALNICSEQVRLPLVPASKNLMNKIAELIDRDFEIISEK
jgi:4-hydroxy-tetrahydrodipicolinate synthase